jgi:hypothetical protein
MARNNKKMERKLAKVDSAKANKPLAISMTNMVK